MSKDLGNILRDYWNRKEHEASAADALEEQQKRIEELTGQLDEWQDRMKHFLTLSEQQINYLMEEREQDIEQIAKLTVAADQVYKFLNEICTVGGAYGYHQGALVGDARQLMAQLKAAKAT